MEHSVECYLSRRLTALASVLLALVGVLTFASAPALAGETYPLVSSFAVSGTPYGVAVDQADGDVYVVEGTEVQVFSPVNRSNPSEGYTAGSPLSGLSSAHDATVDGSGDVYVADFGADAVDKFSGGALSGTFGAGATPEGLTEPIGVAVDPSDGDVYVSDAGHSVVDVYSATGTFEKQFKTGSEPTSLAFDSLGSDLYVVTEPEKVEEYEASGKFVDVIVSGGEPGAIAVDPSTNDLYVTGDQRVSVYGPSGAPLSPSEFSTPIAKSFGIAVDETSRAVFVTNPSTKMVEVHQQINESPLTVFVSGEGKVNSASPGIDECTAKPGGKCMAEFAGLVTLTAKPEPGYVFAGWIGCKHAGSEICEVDMIAASEVTAVFLKEGKVGSEGKEGKEGPQGREGEEGAFGPMGSVGAAGVRGEKGATGAGGAGGAQGPAGPAGPTGPAGKEGPAGKVELVTCKRVNKKQRCTSKLVSGTVKFTAAGLSAKATLSRHGVVYAAGIARGVRGRMSLRLTPLRRLGPGHYALTLISGAGRSERIRDESFTLQ